MTVKKINKGVRFLYKNKWYTKDNLHELSEKELLSLQERGILVLKKESNVKPKKQKQ